MKKQLLAGVAAVALVFAIGPGEVHANPTVKNVANVNAGGDGGDGGYGHYYGGGGGDGGEGSVEIGTVAIEVDVEQENEGIHGGSADGGEGGDDNWAEGGEGALAVIGGASAGDGGEGGDGGYATGRNTAHISIENGNTAVMAENDFYAENELSFDNFISTGDNDASMDGGEATGGDGGEAEGGSTFGLALGALAIADSEAYLFSEAEANAASGNAEGGEGGSAEGGEGGELTTGRVDLSTGHLRLSGNALKYAAGQFVVGTATGIAGNAIQGGNSVAAHVPVGITVGRH